jgi:hypothetical protein
VPKNIRPEGDDQPWKRAVDEELRELRQIIVVLQNQIKQGN